MATVVGAVVIFNLYVSVRVVRDDLNEVVQKITYIILTWFLPLVGGIVALYVIRPEDRYVSRRHEASGHEASGPIQLDD